jgi:GT2 family glycosyltransferase
LKDCLDSLLRQNDSYENLEIIIVDDGSSNGPNPTVTTLMQSHPFIQYIYQTHAGVARARNQGIKHAKGGIIAFVADDYILPATYIKHVREFFSSHTDANIVRGRIVASNHQFINQINQFNYDVSLRSHLVSKDPITSAGWYFHLKRTFLKLPPIPETPTTKHHLDASSAAVFKRQVFDQVGFFNENLERFEDTEMASRLRKEGIEIYFDPRMVIQHQDSESLFGSLRKNIRSGVNYYKFLRPKNKCLETQSSSLLSVSRKMLLNLLRTIYEITLTPIWRAVQADSVKNFLLYLPFMYLFQLTFMIGIALGPFQPDRKPDQNNPHAGF